MLKVSKAFELDSKVRSALSWIERLELPCIFPSLASVKISDELDSIHSSEFGSSHIQDKMSIIFALERLEMKIVDFG